MGTGDGVAEVDEVVKLLLEILTEHVHVQIVGVLSEGVLDFAGNTLHTVKGEGDQGHQGNSVPAQELEESEGKSHAVQVNNLTPIIER